MIFSSLALLPLIAQGVFGKSTVVDSYAEDIRGHQIMTYKLDLELNVTEFDTCFNSTNDDVVFYLISSDEYEWGGLGVHNEDVYNHRNIINCLYEQKARNQAIVCAGECNFDGYNKAEGEILKWKGLLHQAILDVDNSGVHWHTVNNSS